MSGTINFRKDRNRWLVKWWHRDHKKQYRISRYKGQLMHMTHPNQRKDYGYKCATKLLAEIQNSWQEYLDGNAEFRIEKWTKAGYTNVPEYFEEWLETKAKKKPATYKGYKSYFKNWINPFFETNPVMLHEIQLPVLNKMLNFIALSPKGKYNVMNCFHTFLDYAWRCKRIPEVPPFPKKEDYELTDPVIDWIDSETWWRVVDELPEIHKPVFLWMYYHLMRTAEACAIRWEDWDELNQEFMVRRSISARSEVDGTKTGKIYLTPCHTDFVPYMKELVKKRGESPFIFTNPLARKDGKRYTNESLNGIWRKACKKIGISIKLYAAVRHSRATQMSVELNMSAHEIKEAGTWERIESVYKYRSLQTDRKRSLLERKVVPQKGLKRVK